MTRGLMPTSPISFIRFARQQAIRRENTQENLMLQLMSVKTKARVRVGFVEVDEQYNDLILNSPMKDFKVFKQELKKYLRVLNEIKK